MQLIACHRSPSHRASIAFAGPGLMFAFIAAALVAAALGVAITARLSATAWLGAVGAVLAGTLLIAFRRERRLRARLAHLRGDIDARTGLAASAARLRGYFTHAPVGTIVLRLADNDRFVIDDINLAAAAIYGVDAAAVVGTGLDQALPASIAREKAAHLRQCLARRHAVTYSALRELGGQMRVLDIVLTPLPDVSGAAAGVLCCVQDVTAQRALESQVLQDAERRSQAKQREAALLHTCTDVLAMLRVDHDADPPCFVYETISPHLERVTGLRPDRLIGQRPFDCLSPALAARQEAQYRTCLQAGATIRYSLNADLPIGARLFEASLTPVRHPVTGRITHLAEALRDVTELQAMRAELRHGQQMHAVGQLATGVAHDFNNLLQGFTGALELLLDELDPGSEAQTLAAKALSAAERGSYLTHHLLSCARPQMPQPQSLDAGAFLTDLQPLLARSLGPHISVVVRAAPELARLRADPGQLQTALLNLAINASDAMKGGGVLTLAAEPGDAESGRNGAEHAASGAAGGDWIDLRVIDTGAGMDTATLARVFEPFFSTKGSDGLGLGLSMVHGFAAQSGGTVRIDSAPGHGTAVVLRLPGAAVPGASEADRQLQPSLLCGRVLLVDDAPDVLLTTGAFLKAAGLTVVRATCGGQVLDQLAAGERFDAVVTDFAMPGMNGIDVIAELRGLQPDLPALVITGYADLQSNRRLPSDVSVLSKPFPRDRLIEAVRRAMARDPAESMPCEPAGTRPK